MKKLLPLLAILFVLFLLVTTPWKKAPDADLTDRVKLVDVNRLGGAMAVFCDEDDPAVYFLGLTDASFADEAGQSTSFQALAPGMIVEIDWNGLVKESYPPGIDAAAVRVVRQEDDLVGLYRSALTALWEEQGALTDGAKQLAFDLSALSHLSPAEQTALSYLCSCKMGYLPYVLSGKPAEGTVLFTLSPEGDPGTGSFSFTVELVRDAGSPVSACFEASRGDNGGWEYSKLS